MEIDNLKEQLPEEAFEQLSQYVNDLVGQRDQARNESINGRRQMKEELAALRNSQTSLMEKLGVESLDDLETLPDAKGLAEAQAQYDVKIKRLERNNAELMEQLGLVEQRYKQTRQKSAIQTALGEYDFIAKDLVEAHLSQNLVWEEDELLYKTDDGKLLSLADGVAGMAKSRPELLKSTGARGAGVRSTQARGDGGEKIMTRAEFEALTPQQRVDVSKAGVKVT